MSIVEHLRECIEKGAFSQGARLPSIRILSRDHGVSMTTVLQAYHQLESDGFIESKPQSGYYVKNRCKLDCPDKVEAPLPTFSTAQDQQESIDFQYYMEHPGLLLGSGYPCMDAPTLAPLFTALHRRGKGFAQQSLSRGNPAGLAPLREQISRLMLTAGCQSQPDDILITNGCQEALYIALRASCEPGDLVAVESPCYFGILQLLRTANITPVEIPADPTQGISLEALSVALETLPIKALYLSPNCNNPQGYVMPDARKQRLLTLAEQHNITIIEDDIYGELSYLLPRPKPIKAWDTTGRVILCSSFSKTLTPDIRTGWIYATAQQDKLLKLKLVASGISTIVPQMAISDFIAQGDYAKHVRKMRRTYRQNLAVLEEHIVAHFPKETHFVLPKGGYNLWINMPAELRIRALCQQLESKKIKITPGPLFSSRQRFTTSLRLSFSSLHLGNASEIIASLAQSVSQCLTYTDSSLSR